MDDLNAYLLQKYGGGGQQQPPSQNPSANQQQPPSSFDQTNPSIVALLQHRQELDLRQQLLALQEAKLQQQHDVQQALQAAGRGSADNEEHRLLSSRVAQLEGTYNNRQHVQDDLRTRLEQELLKRKATELLLQRGAAAAATLQQPEEKQPAGIPRAIPHSMGGGVSTSLQPPTAKGKHNIPPDVKEQEKIRLRQDILQQQLREQQTLLTNGQQHGTELDTYQYKLQLLKQLEQSRQLKLDAAVARLLPNNNPTPPITNTTNPTVNSQGAIVTSPNTGGRWDHGGHGNTYTLTSPNNVRVGDNSFPSKLHDVLSYCERANLTHVISWLPHGRAFKIHDKDQFMSIVSPRFFKATKLRSFHRQLYLWGFARVPSDREAWYHELFMRGRQDDIHLMERVTRVKGEKGSIPNLWALPPINDLRPGSGATGSLPSIHHPFAAAAAALPPGSLLPTAAAEYNSAAQLDMSNISAYEKSIAALQKAELIHAQREKTLRIALGNSSNSETAAPAQSLANATPEERLQVLRNLDQETLLALRDKTLKEALQKSVQSPDTKEKADAAAPSETSPTARSVSEENSVLDQKISVSEELDQKKASASPDAPAEAKAETEADEMEEDKAEADPPNKEEDVSSPKKVDENKVEEMEEDKADEMVYDKAEKMEEDKKPEGSRRLSASDEPEGGAATDAISSLLALSKQAE